jgi:photosystem II stability/assembly factor-like uncharacterized protein
MEKLKKFNRIFVLLLSFTFLISPMNVNAKKKNQEKEKTSALKASTFSGLKWRSIGPAFTSGRIADIVVNPENHSEWYVGVASGNIWKTTNNGTTFTPVFDKYGSYSIGCLTIDPNQTNVIWAGTGENNHQRALGYGDGVYKSTDNGKTWKNMGLKESRQIGMITIDPRNSDIVFVAAEGSVWGPGGDRGLYKTWDGGKTWEKVLEVSENTGINNVIMDPSNPDIMLATSEQRRRHVFTKIGGGPESAVYKSTDGGKNWKKITNGLPSGNLGGMGIAISPANPDIAYIIMEAEGDKGGFYRSTNKGESWEKMSSYHSSGQYYNEIVCDPKDPDKVYSTETITKVTLDGGKTWKSLGNNNRHVDDHALWIDPTNTSHFIIGGDGGVYESFDAGKNYLFKSNLPVTQFYRVAVDNDLPFYNVYGGTQDNNSYGGPSRNTSSSGVGIGDWVVTVGGDGFWQAVDPENPNIVYSEWQYGNCVRFDKSSGERINIKPQPRKGEDTYKWNWNAPLIISPHSHTRIYLAANKVFRSDDRGNSWKVISDDLSTKTDRNTWKVMGKFWSVDAVRKDISTSQFGTIVSLAESEVKEDLLYVGTDDGAIQVTENAGKEWSMQKTFTGVPEYTYVSDICPSKFDENIVFASFDNRKRDDFKPYLLKSTDKGKSWASIAANLPEQGTVHTIEQDFVNPDLLFAGTEFGMFFSVDGGKEWIKLQSGLPTISVRDIVIQQRENDLAIATFGRGFYILDDYTPLRTFKKEMLDEEAIIYPVKDALMYVQTGGRYGQGSTPYMGKNPPFGATFTYYLKEVPKTQKQIRKELEKKQFEKGEKIKVLTPEELKEESEEEKPQLIFTIYDAQDKTVRIIRTSPSKGINRISWNLRNSSPRPVRLSGDKFNPLAKSNDGYLVLPGTYKVGLSLSSKGQIKELVQPVTFTVVDLKNTTLPAPDRKALVEFQDKVSELAKTMLGTTRYASELSKKTEVVLQTLYEWNNATPEMIKQAKQIREDLDMIQFKFTGFRAKASWEEVPPGPQPLNKRLNYLMYTHNSTTTAVTQTEKDAYEILKGELPSVINELTETGKELDALQKKMLDAGAPWTPGLLPAL